MSKIKNILIFPILIILFFLLNKVFRVFILENTLFYFSVEEIYGFNLLLTLIVLFILFKIGQKFPDKIGFSFLALSILKMAASVAYLYKFIDSDFENKNPDILNFFLVYFVFLFVESVLVVKWINFEGK